MLRIIRVSESESRRCIDLRGSADGCLWSRCVDRAWAVVGDDQVGTIIHDVKLSMRTHTMIMA